MLSKRIKKVPLLSHPATPLTDSKFVARQKLVLCLHICCDKRVRPGAVKYILVKYSIVVKGALRLID